MNSQNSVHYLLVTVGSHGDVHPFVGLGIALRKRGHEVTIVTSGHFEKLIRSAGLGFIEMGTDEEFRRELQNPAMWHRTKAFKAVFNLVGQMIEKTYDIIAEQHNARRTIVVASSLALGARVAQEKLHVPTVTIHLSPAILRSEHEAPRLPGLFMPRWMPKRIKRAIWKLGDVCIIDPLVGPMVNGARQKVGLTPPVRGILRDWWHSPSLVIGMWPDWFGAVQPDWPVQTRLVGFPLYDESGIAGISPEMDEWLKAGDAPIAFCPASAMVHAKSFFKASAEACAKLNRRGLLLTRHHEQVPKHLPPMVRHFDYAPFKALLPRVAALVHNGGIGTTAQAFCAGIPQVVVPLAHDQLDNAARVKKLGVGSSIHPRRYTAARSEKVLKELLNSPNVENACRDVARRFIGARALDHACDLIEHMARRNGSPQVPENPQLSTS